MKSPTHIRVVSDLHLEQYFGTKIDYLATKFIPPDELDENSILVLAGDISSKLGQLTPFIAETKKRFPYVIYIPGNHEFYGYDLSDWSTKFLSDPLIKDQENLFVATHDVREEIIGKVRYLFTTLWAAGGKDKWEDIMIGQGLRDFYVIKKEGRLFRTADMVALHKVQLAALEARLKTPFDGKTVVITHHMPSMRLCHPRFGTDLNGGFASNLDALLASDHAPALWIHGHTHDTIDTTLWKTHILCNPAGYRNEGDTAYLNYAPTFAEIATL